MDKTYCYSHHDKYGWRERMDKLNKIALNEAGVRTKYYVSDSGSVSFLRKMTIQWENDCLVLGHVYVVHAFTDTKKKKYIKEKHF